MKRNVFFPLVPIAHELGNLVDDFVNKGMNDVFGGSILQYNMPSANIKETDNNFSIDLAAPGLEKQDFKISVEQNQLVVSSEKEKSSEEKDDNYFRKEFSFHSFKRSFRLPEHADESNIKASYNNGVLNILIGKKTIIKNEKTIEVK
ncbi:MAG: Hsp20 family protein [Saprospiraceae bacterium]|nr:Hsp20 family protein [Saprospiraceae bacterium]